MTDRMKKYKTYFPEDTTIDTPDCIDGEYLSGTFDWWLDETGRSPEEIGVSYEAIVQRYREKEFKDAAAKSPALIEENGVSTSVVAGVIDQLMRPLFESMAKVLKDNAEAIEHIAANQDIIRNRMEALEKQVRLQTPVTDRQARYLADAARTRAKELLGEECMKATRAVTKLSGIIKKAVLIRYGYESLREIPRCEYDVAMKQIESWNKPMTVYEIMEEARAALEAME